MGGGSSSGSLGVGVAEKGKGSGSGLGPRRVRLSIFCGGVGGRGGFRLSLIFWWGRGGVRRGSASGSGSGAPHAIVIIRNPNNSIGNYLGPQFTP